MYDNCPECRLKYEKEPGFFYGAMYVSYALTVALWVGVAIISFGIFSFSPWVFLGFGISLLLILIPLIYRLSRVIWMNIFIHYKSNGSEKIIK